MAEEPDLTIGFLCVGIGVEVYDDGQQEEDEQFLEDANDMVIEVPDHPSPMGSPHELSPRSSQGSRLSTTAEQKAKESSPWAQTEMQVNIGIEEVSVFVYNTRYLTFKGRITLYPVDKSLCYIPLLYTCYQVKL